MIEIVETQTGYVVHGPIYMFMKAIANYINNMCIFLEENPLLLILLAIAMVMFAVTWINDLYKLNKRIGEVKEDENRKD